MFLHRLIAMKYYHLTARTRWPHKPFTDREVCADLWGRLQKRFPKVLACVLMPNHLHIVLYGAHPEAARQILAIELRAFTQSQFPGLRLWEEVPPPEMIQDRKHLARFIRYVHLNPSRARLVDDPLEWEWSTHRDAVGGAAPTWIDLGMLMQIFKADPRKLAEVIHRYVSGDPTVHVASTPLIWSRPSGELFLPQTLMRAVWIATRSPSRLTAESRFLVARLVPRYSRVSAVEVGDALQITSGQVRRLLRDPAGAVETRSLQAVERVLLDPRMLYGPPPQEVSTMHAFGAFRRG